jgi:hypothetical protein
VCGGGGQGGCVFMLMLQLECADKMKDKLAKVCGAGQLGRCTAVCVCVDSVAAARRYKGIRSKQGLADRTERCPVCSQCRAFLQYTECVCVWG